MAGLTSYDNGLRILYVLEYLHNSEEPPQGEDSVRVFPTRLAKYLSEEYGIPTKKETAEDILDAIYESDTGYLLTRKESPKGQKQYYYRRPFTLAQLSLLSTIISSSMFLNEAEINKLLEQVKTLTSEENAKVLSASDHFLRPRMMNDGALDNLRIIHEAINEKQALRFYIGSVDVNNHIYYDKMIRGKSSECQRLTVICDTENRKIKTQKHNVKKQYPNQGKPIICIPYSLAWDNSRCYLICGLQNTNKTRIYLWNYRVDRMFELKIWEKKRYDDPPSPYRNPKTKEIDAERYLHSIFKMFPSMNPPTTVKIRFKNKLTRVMTEHFGSSIQIDSENDEYSCVKVEVQATRQFYGWLAGFQASELCLVEPQSEVEQYLKYLQDIIDSYHN